ncbi:MAG: ABC transporter [Candidatus Methanomethylicota archaeon]|uniref:ABC transporter n=1 Tax=Thermoproteota archaeon TaxID=2056631 RepID=A0A497F2G0_9CREN|nr:MAG: ABC transporter [Candidatus Verstraetearchaeota archaeon]
MVSVQLKSIVVQDLHCSYGSREVLRGVNLSVSSGEVAAIVGVSGSGKSTLAYCLSGIIPHKIEAEVSGEISIDDTNYRELSFRDIISHVNIVMEDYESQIFGLTVEEDIAFGLENLGLPRSEIANRLDWALMAFDLIDRRKALVSELSGGLKQRLAIASTAVLKPDFLILDNPTSNLDWPGILKLKQLVQELKTSGSGVILMLRKIKGFEECIDKIYILNSGSLRQVEFSNSALTPQFKPLIRNSRESVGSALISIEDVWFKYGGPYVLKGINLKVYAGESLVVMGCNGSGKTTLMKHLNGLLKPCKGRVVVCGRDTRNFSAAQMARFVGLAFQDPDKHLFAETVWEEVSFGCRNLNLPLENATKALKLLKLVELKDKPIHELSMGEKVRVVVASALALDPKVLVLDEPTTGQDYDLLQELAYLIYKLKVSGKAVVVVTHDSDFALAIADRIAVMNDGKIAYCGKPMEILYNEEVVEKAKLEPPSQARLLEVRG